MVSASVIRLQWILRDADMSADDAARHCRSRRTSAPLSDAAIVSSRLVLRPGNRLLSPPVVADALALYSCTTDSKIDRASETGF